MTNPRRANGKKRALLRKVADNLDADVIVFAGDIDSPADYEFLARVKAGKSRKNVLLLLTTQGGDADSAYRMGRCLQRHYADGRITVYVDLFCKSAGTLLAICADDLVMSDWAELGPLDIQLRKPDELFERLSGLTPIQALTTLRVQSWKSFEDYFLNLRKRSRLQITTKTAAEIAAQVAIGLFRPIYAKLDPMRLGEIERGMLIAQQYGDRLNHGNLKTGALDQLIAAYPSHGFIIDKEEAETLFENVRSPHREEKRLAKGLCRWSIEAMHEEQAKMQFFSGEAENEKEQNSKQGDENALQHLAKSATTRRSGGSPVGNGEPNSAGEKHDAEKKEDGETDRSSQTNGGVASSDP